MCNRVIVRPLLAPCQVLLFCCIGSPNALAGVILTFPDVHVPTPLGANPVIYSVDIPIKVVGTVDNAAGYNIKLDLLPANPAVQFVDATTPPNPLFTATNFGVFQIGDSLAAADVLNAGQSVPVV